MYNEGVESEDNITTKFGECAVCKAFDHNLVKNSHPRLLNMVSMTLAELAIGDNAWFFLPECHGDGGQPDHVVFYGKGRDRKPICIVECTHICESMINTPHYQYDTKTRKYKHFNLPVIHIWDESQKARLKKQLFGLKAGKKLSTEKMFRGAKEEKTLIFEEDVQKYWEKRNRAFAKATA